MKATKLLPPLPLARSVFSSIVSAGFISSFPYLMSGMHTYTAHLVKSRCHCNKSNHVTLSSRHRILRSMDVEQNAWRVALSLTDDWLCESSWRGIVTGVGKDTYAHTQSSNMPTCFALTGKACWNRDRGMARKGGRDESSRISFRVSAVFVFCSSAFRC